VKNTSLKFHRPKISAVSAHARLVASALAAGVLMAEFRQTSLAEGLHRLTHGSGLPAMIDLDPHLLKTHERPHAHAAGQQDPDPVLGQMAHRSHAAALFVRDVGDDVDGGYLTAVEGDEDVKLAVPEMSSQGGIQASGGFGRYSNDGAHLLSSPFIY
jgi:hypothetical protein